MASQFVKTGSVLDEILIHKIEETTARKQETSLSALEALIKEVDVPRDFFGALQQDIVALIAEVKKASPSKGVLIEDFDPVRIATTYAQNGASAISVLADEKYFQGSARYLEVVHAAVERPLLFKEFVIDPYQVYLGRKSCADAILLIVAALSDSQLSELHALVSELGMTALVEVHNEDEMERALKIDAKLIGINNRDLKTFTVDLDTTARLAKLVPDDVVLVAESGIKSAGDVRKMGELGARAVLVGESLVKSRDMAQAVRDYSSQPI